MASHEHTQEFVRDFHGPSMPLKSMRGNGGSCKLNSFTALGLMLKCYTAILIHSISVGDPNRGTLW